MFLEEAYTLFSEAFNRIREAMPGLGSHLEFTCNRFTLVYSEFLDKKRKRWLVYKTDDTELLVSSGKGKAC